jgi:hypothetical protein
MFPLPGSARNAVLERKTSRWLRSSRRTLHAGADFWREAMSLLYSASHTAALHSEPRPCLTQFPTLT